MIVHLGHFAFARPKALDDGADEGFRNVDGEMLDRLHHFAVDGAGDNLRTANHQFESFTAHHLDQDGELQFATTQNFEAIGAARVLDTDGNIRQQLFVQAFTKVTRGDELAFTSSKWRVVDRELNGDCRLVDDDSRQRRRILYTCDGLANRDALDAGNSNDVASFSGFNINALQSGEAEELGDASLVQSAVAPGDVDLVASTQRSVEDACDGQAAKIIGVIEIRHQNLQGTFGVAAGGRD